MTGQQQPLVRSEVNPNLVQRGVTAGRDRHFITFRQMLATNPRHKLISCGQPGETGILFRFQKGAAYVIQFETEVALRHYPLVHRENL